MKKFYQNNRQVDKKKMKLVERPAHDSVAFHVSEN